MILSKLSYYIKRTFSGSDACCKNILLTLALLDFKWSLKYPFSSLPCGDPDINCESWSNLLAKLATRHGTSIQVNKSAFMLSKSVFP